MKLKTKIARILLQLAYKLDPICGFAPSEPIQLDASIYEMTTLTCHQVFQHKSVETAMDVVKKQLCNRLTNKLITLHDKLFEITSTPLYDDDVLLSAKLHLLKKKTEA